MANKSAFLKNVREILKSAHKDLSKIEESNSVLRKAEINERNFVEEMKEINLELQENLLSEFISRAEAAAWNVVTVESENGINEAITKICANVSATKIILTNEDILAESRVAVNLKTVGLKVETLNTKDNDPEKIKTIAFGSDLGITGADYLIAETGTLVLHPTQGISRLVSLVPPVHIAVAKKTQIIPSLDELFLLEQYEHNRGNRASSMNLISGPSKTGDIEGEIVYGIHGPIETYLVLLQ